MDPPNVTAIVPVAPVVPESETFAVAVPAEALIGTVPVRLVTGWV